MSFSNPNNNSDSEYSQVLHVPVVGYLLHTKKNNSAPTAECKDHMEHFRMSGTWE